MEIRKNTILVSRVGKLYVLQYVYDLKKLIWPYT